jgi:hypothetical protein
VQSVFSPAELAAGWRLAGQILPTENLLINRS